MKKVSIFIIIFICGFVSAKSLWNENFNLYTPQNRYKIGDTIKIIFNEKRVVQYQAETSSFQQSSISGGNSLKGLVEFLPKISGEDSIKGSRKGSTKTDGRIEASIAATVTNILENGNLAIHGRHRILVNDQLDRIEISGIVNPANIKSGNEIYSSDIADVSIVYQSKILKPVTFNMNDLIEMQTLSTNTNILYGEKSYSLSPDKKKELILYYINKIVSTLFD